MEQELNEQDRAELARLISEGFNHGRLDSEEKRITWGLSYEIF